jgi:putative thioredoxin
MANSPWVIDITAATFQQQVIERSRELPVVMDFWAPWCGPCRALGPILERLAAEMNGRFLLAKVNTDENQDLAAGFQIEGIPAVFAIRDGKLVDRFEGLLPEDQVREFINRLVGEAAPDPAADALTLEGRDPAAAQRAYREALAAKPDDEAARIGLARVLLASPDHEAEAADLLRPIEVGELAGEADRLRTVIKLREAPHGEAELAAARANVAANPESAEAYLQLGRVLAAGGEYTLALQALLDAAARDRALGTSAVRELMVEIFTVIGPRSPEADEYRRRLQNMLY